MDWKELIKAVVDVDTSIITDQRAPMLKALLPTPDEAHKLLEAKSQPDLSVGDKFLLALMEVPG